MADLLAKWLNEDIKLSKVSLKKHILRIVIDMGKK